MVRTGGVLTKHRLIADPSTVNNAKGIYLTWSLKKEHRLGVLKELKEEKEFIEDYKAEKDLEELKEEKESIEDDKVEKDLRKFSL